MKTRHSNRHRENEAAASNITVIAFVMFWMFLLFTTPAFAGMHSDEPLTPEREAARRAITFGVQPEPQPEPFPIESFGYGYARGNFLELERREAENPDAFRREPVEAPYRDIFGQGSATVATTGAFAWAPLQADDRGIN